MIEVLPNPSNRVSVDPAYKDQLGNMRPVISYNIPDYTMRGAVFARRLARRIFQRLGAEDYTTYDPADYGYLTYEGEGYVDPGRKPPGRDAHHGHEPGQLGGGLRHSARGTTRISIWSAAAACPRSARQTSRSRLPHSASGVRRT